MIAEKEGLTQRGAGLGPERGRDGSRRGGNTLFDGARCIEVAAPRKFCSVTVAVSVCVHSPSLEVWTGPAGCLQRAWRPFHRLLIAIETTRWPPCRIRPHRARRRCRRGLHPGYPQRPAHG